MKKQEFFNPGYLNKADPFEQPTGKAAPEALECLPSPFLHLEISY